MIFVCSFTLLDSVLHAIRFHNNRGVCVCPQQFEPMGHHLSTRGGCFQWPTCLAVAVSLESDILSRVSQSKLTAFMNRVELWQNFGMFDCVSGTNMPLWKSGVMGVVLVKSRKKLIGELEKS